MLSNSSVQNLLSSGVTVARSSRLKLTRASAGGFSGIGCVGHAWSPGSLVAQQGTALEGALAELVGVCDIRPDRADDPRRCGGIRAARLDPRAGVALVCPGRERAPGASDCVEVAVHRERDVPGGERAQRGRHHLGADPGGISDGETDAWAGGAGARAQRSSGATTSM